MRTNMAVFIILVLLAIVYLLAGNHICSSLFFIAAAFYGSIKS